MKKAGNFSYKLIKPDEGDNLNVLSSISGTSTVCFKTEKNGTNIRIYFEEVYNKDCYEFAVRDATPKVFLEFCKRAAGISEEELMEGRKKIYKAEIGSDDCLEAFIPNRYVTDVKVYIKLKKGYKGGNARQFNKSDEGIFGYYTKDSYDKTANIQTFVLNGTDFWKKCLDRQLERWDRNGYFDGVKGNCPLKDKLRRIEDLAYDDNRTKFFSWETKGGHLYPYGNTIPFSKIRGIRLPDVQMCPLGDDDDYAHTAMAMMGIHYVDCQTQCFIKLMLKYLCGEDYDKYNIKIKGLSSHSIRVTYTENGEEKKYFFQLLHLYSGEEYDAILKERSNEDGDIYEFLTDDFIKGAHSQSGNYSEVYAERYWEHFKK